MIPFFSFAGRGKEHSPESAGDPGDHRILPEEPLGDV